MQKDRECKQINSKKAWVAMSYQAGWTSTQKLLAEINGIFHKDKMSIHQEDITTLHLYAHNGALLCTKKKCDRKK